MPIVPRAHLAMIKPRFALGRLKTLLDRPAQADDGGEFFQFRDMRRSLAEAQRSEVAKWVEDGPDLKTDGVVRWRCADLRDRIAAKFNVHLH